MQDILTNFLLLSIIGIEVAKINTSFWLSSVASIMGFFIVIEAFDVNLFPFQDLANINNNSQVLFFRFLVYFYLCL